MRKVENNDKTVNNIKVKEETGIATINRYFHEIKKRGHNLFVPYIVAGDGGFDRLLEQMKLLEESGVAAIELGIPFSDPIADGPTIQRAGLRALKDGVSLRSVLQFLEGTKLQRNVPVVLMTYFNPIFTYGVTQFTKDCKHADVSGIIIPDVPLEEEQIISDTLRSNGIAFIRLIALTSTEERMRKLAKRSEGFLYAVSVTGTTGARAKHDEQVASYLEKLKQLSDVPVLAGFGVSRAEQAKELSKHCDGVIVGSTIVDLFHERNDDGVRKLIKASL